jgi:hypothetical protein
MKAIYTSEISATLPTSAQCKNSRAESVEMRKVAKYM